MNETIEGFLTKLTKNVIFEWSLWSINDVKNILPIPRNGDNIEQTIVVRIIKRIQYIYKQILHPCEEFQYLNIDEQRNNIYHQ